MARQPQALRFIVEGTGEFPFDMLRYDQCWPAGEVDASQMMEHNNHGLVKRKVVLETFNKHAPTSGRWASFLWRVVS